VVPSSAASLREQTIERGLLRGERPARLIVHKCRDGAFAEIEHFIDLDQREAADTTGRMINEHVGRVEMVLQRVAQGGQGVPVNPKEQALDVRRVEDVVEECIERHIWNGIEPERRFAHLGHALAPGRGVLGGVMRVQTESHLQLVGRLGRQALDENLVQAAESPVVTLEAGNAFIDAGSEAHGLVHGADASKRWQIAVRAIFRGGHGSENAP